MSKNSFQEELSMRVLAVLLFLLTIPQTAFSQAALGPVDRLYLPPYDLNRVVPGNMAPDFRLQDQDGKVHQLSDYHGKNVVLVMYRGYW
jgi:cytochrome oxidase Cu insertion factor (SCO1/SenC/PrrC family)